MIQSRRHSLNGAALLLMRSLGPSNAPLSVSSHQVLYLARQRRDHAALNYDRCATLIESIREEGTNREPSLCVERQTPNGSTN
jgi:hypothetical protein